MTIKKKGKIFTLEVRGLSLPVTEVLFSRLTSLAKSTNMGVGDYIEKILKNNVLPAQDFSEKDILIILYDFCLADCVRAEKATSNLQPEKR